MIVQCEQAEWTENKNKIVIWFQNLLQEMGGSSPKDLAPLAGTSHNP